MASSVPRQALAVSLALTTLTACQHLDKKAEVGLDAAVGPPADGGTTSPGPSGKSTLPMTFELVAAGRHSGSKIVWLKLIGDRVWLSGMGLDAYADGEGPLATAPDLTQGLHQKQGERYDFVGSGSELFALRSQPETAKSEDRPEVWVRAGTAPWSSGTKVPHFYGVQNLLQDFGFTRWKDGALLITSQVSTGTSMALFAPNAPGTDFQTISPKGEIKDAAFSLPKEVMAWSADSDGAKLALVGYRAHNLRAVGISVFRGDDKGPLTETPIMGDPGTQDPHALSSIGVREQGKAALVFITKQYYGGGPLSSLASTVFVVDDKAKAPKKIQFAPAAKGAVVAAAYVGDSIYATVELQEHFTLSRAVGSAEPIPVKLPSLGKGGSGFRVAKDGEAGLTCEAIDLFARKDDLWVQATCSGQGLKVPAVFRLGHAQEPILLP